MEWRFPQQLSIPVPSSGIVPALGERLPFERNER